jgi:hypothetical protein
MGRDWNSLLNPPKFDVPILKIETYPIRRTIQPGLLALLGVLLSACGDEGKSKPEVVAVESSNVAKVPTRPAESPFVHPGLLSTKADLERMAAKVAAGEEPWIGSWDILVRNTDGFLRHNPEATPTVYVDSDKGSNFIRLARDAARGYQLALRYHGSGDKRFADKAVQIYNAWATTHGPAGKDPEPDGNSEGWYGNTNAGLRQGLYGYQFACGAELLREYEGWDRKDFKRFQAYMLDEFYTGNKWFLEARYGTVPTHYWANWVHANQASMMAIGVLCDDRAIFSKAVDYFHNGPGNENIRQAVQFVHPDGLGQWQESGRDQGHSLMGPQLLGTVCEIAWNQGVDLYGAQDNRFLAGVEYISKYNVGHEVPWTTYVYVHKHPGKELFWVQTNVNGGGRGILRPGWDLVYNHYVNRKGMAAPWTEKYARRNRPEGGGFNFGGTSGGFDGLGFTTLTHSLEPIAKGAPPGTPRVVVQGRQIALSWTGSAHAESYDVKRATQSGGPYTTIATTGRMLLSYIDPGLTAGTTYSYVVSANNPDGTVADSKEAKATADGKLHGKVIGTEGSYKNSGASITTLFDGSFDNYFDPPTTNAWAGIDIGEGVTAKVTKVKYAPRKYFGGRMVGGTFQGSNTADFSEGVSDLCTIANGPPDGVLTSQVVQSNTPFRYLRYIQTTGERWCNVAEIEFYGEVHGQVAPQAPAAPVAAPDESKVDLSWKSVPRATRYNIKRATSPDGPFTLIANTAGTSFRDDGLAPGSYHYVVSSLNDAGESQDSKVAGGQLIGNIKLDGASFTANAHSTYWGADTEGPAKAFDGDRNTQWYSGDGHASGWLQVHLGAGKDATVARYSLTSSKDVPGRDPKDWELHGSTDGKNWTPLDNRKDETFGRRGETKTYPVSRPGSYRHYGLNIRSNQSGNPKDGIQLAELEFLGHSSTQPVTPMKTKEVIRTQREITRAELEDKVAGYWLGQIIGNYFGFPFELLYIEEPVPVTVDKFFTQRNNGNIKINTDWRGNMDQQVRDYHGAPSDDDHDLEFLTLHGVEMYGLDITYEEIAPMLDKHVTRMVWVSTERAVKAIRKGAMPPATGTMQNNPWWHDLMASISTEIWGSFYPGMTGEAAAGAEWFGRITNDDYALYLAKFYAAMISAAYFESDYDQLLRLGMAQIPQDNILYQGILDVQKWFTENPDWRVTRKLIYDKYYKRDKPKDLSSIVDALPNGLMGIMALIYAKGDFKETLSIATTAGLDSDNQPATLGALIGVVNGAKNLPEDYKMIHTENAAEPFYGTYANHTREGLPEKTKISDIVTRIANVAEKAILANGGKKVTNAKGETAYLIQADF